MVTKPRRGELKVDAGRLVYKPGPEFWQHCSDRFTYRLSDRDDYSGAISLPAAVTLSCHPVFVDGFDSQSVAAWVKGEAAGGARLDVAERAAMVGSHGLAVAVTGQDSDRAFVTAMVAGTALAWSSSVQENCCQESESIPTVSGAQKSRLMPSATLAKLFCPST